jgi:uncharacterized protein YjdB
MKNRLRSQAWTAYASLALLAGLGAACSGGGTEPGGGNVEIVAVTPAAPSVAVGNTLQLSAVALGAGRAELPDRSVVWASADSTVASVSGDGMITAKKLGSVQIQAAIEGKSAYAFVSVVPRPIATVAVAPAAVAVAAGTTSQLQVALTDDRGGAATGQPVVWRSSNDAFARVTSTGLVSGVAPGTATITATAGEGKTGSATVTVTGSVAGGGTSGAVVTRVSVQPGPATPVFLNEPLQLTVTAFDASGALVAGRAAAWTTSDPAVATVDNATGIVRGVAAGTATITVTIDNSSATTTVTVTRRPTATIEITAPPEVTVGQQVQLTATPRDVNGQPVAGRTVTWASSNESVVAVNRTTGVAEARGAGSAVLTASVEGEAVSSTTIIVKAAGSGGGALKASFAYGCTNLTCAFIDSSSTASGSVTRWRWDFGNGTTSDFTDADVVYTSGGTFTVTLTVTDDKGATASTTARVTVGADVAPAVQLRNRATNTCLSVQGGPGPFPASNTPLVTRACDGGRDQRYSLPSGPGAGPIQLPRYSTRGDPRYENGMFVQLLGAAGSAPLVYHWIGSQEQRWIRVSGTGELRNQVTKTCITATRNSTTVTAEACGRGAGTQSWDAVP